MKKALKIILIIIVCVFAGCITDQAIIKSFEIGNPGAKQRILIASQGSDFKNNLVEGLIASLKEKPVYIKIIDVTTLDRINEAEWDAVVIISTVQFGEIQSDAKKYLDRAKELGKTVVVVTSYEKAKFHNLDAITSASKKDELDGMISVILNKLEKILAQSASAHGSGLPT